MMKLGPAWRDSEIQTLNSGIAANLSWDAIAELLPGRSVGACQARLKRQEALKLNLKHRERVRGARAVKKKNEQRLANTETCGKGQGRGGKPWSFEEDALLKQLLFKGIRAAEVIKAFPHRSAIAVAYRVGINWSKEGGGFDGVDEEDSEADDSCDADESSTGYISPASSPPPPSRNKVPSIIRRYPYAPTAPDCQPSARKRDPMVKSGDNGGSSSASNVAMSIERTLPVQLDRCAKQKTALEELNAKLDALCKQHEGVFSKMTGALD